MSTAFSSEDLVNFWAHLPGGASLGVNLPLPAEPHNCTLFTDEQRRTIAAIGCLLGERFDITVCVPARNLPRMPEGVFCIERAVIHDDGNDVSVRRAAGWPAFLHPNGTLAPFYSPVQK